MVMNDDSGDKKISVSKNVGTCILIIPDNLAQKNSNEVLKEYL